MKKELFCVVLMALKVSLSYSDVRQRKAKMQSGLLAVLT